MANTIATLRRSDGTSPSCQRNAKMDDFAQLTVGSRPSEVLSRACGALQLASSLVPYSSPSYDISTPQGLSDWQYRLTSLQSDLEISHSVLKRGGWLAGESGQLFSTKHFSERAMLRSATCMDVAVDVEVLAPGLYFRVTGCICTLYFLQDGCEAYSETRGQVQQFSLFSLSILFRHWYSATLSTRN